MSRSLMLNISPPFLVFLSTLIGFASSLKNAQGVPTTRDAIILVVSCTVAAALWGIVLAWALGRSTDNLRVNEER
jgi:hypothetical protein